MCVNSLFGTSKSTVRLTTVDRAGQYFAVLKEGANAFYARLKKKFNNLSTVEI